MRVTVTHPLSTQVQNMHSVPMNHQTVALYRLYVLR